MKIFLLSLLTVVIGTVLAFIVSPRPLSWIVYKLFDGGMAVELENFSELESNTYMYKDIAYNSKHSKGKLDIIMKKGMKNPAPVVFWAHGGGYVGGDKSDIREYGVRIANEGFVFVNINYALAPDSTYPTPLIQLSEAYKYIFINKGKYNIDISKCYFGGDSAGAQIVGQFVNTQVDRDYRDRVGIEKLVEDKNIKGVILLCGPYDIKAFRNIENKALNYIMNTIGWAYTGSRNWLESDDFEELSLVDNVSENYPPSFITDGNFLSFEEQGRELSKILKSKGVLVHDVFYPNSIELVHNYQFMMDLEESKNTFRELREFLNISKNI